MVEGGGGGGRRGVVGAGQDSESKTQGVAGIPKMSGSLQGAGQDYGDKRTNFCDITKSSGESKVKEDESNIGRVEAGIKLTKSAIFTLLVCSL